MALAVEGVRYLFALYMLGLSIYSFYLIYLGSQTEYVNNDKLTTEAMSPQLLWNLRALRTTTMNTSIALVVANFVIITYLIFSKFRVGTRF